MLTRFFFPSFNGDIRFEEVSRGTCDLVTAELTPLEQEALKRWAKIAVEKQWIGHGNYERLIAGEVPNGRLRLDGPLSEAAGEMARLLKFRQAGVLTAFAFANGEIKATSVETPTRLPRWAKRLLDKGTKTIEVKDGAVAEVPAKDEARPADVPDEKPKAVAVVSRPSLSCPECQGRPERDRMACDVLWEFLTPTQREEWLHDRSVTVYGGITGHCYRLHPRDSKQAAAYGRVAFDLDDRVILHNFMREVPPEEELLTVKLLLEHREDWLRVWGEVDPAHRASPGTIFDNPFAGRALFGF